MRSDGFFFSYDKQWHTQLFLFSVLFLLLGSFCGSYTALCVAHPR